MAIWPGGNCAAVSLTFDDGMRSQRETAFAILQDAGLRATFYLNPVGTEESAEIGDSWVEGLENWLPVAAAGHEIGNHSLLHPCSLNVYSEWIAQRNLQAWTLERLQADVLEAQRRIRQVFPNQRETSFAYPCYEDSVGKGKTRTCYTPFIADHFTAARFKGELSSDLANDPLVCDLHHLSSFPAERLSGAAMIGLVEGAAILGRWSIFTFHGIQEGHLPVGDGDLRQLAAYLARRSGEIWVAPVAEIGAYLRDALGN
jgi:hypothetical protein